MSYIFCIGESLVDFIAQAGIPDVGASEIFERAAGGAVSNVAVGIARLGGSAHFCGTLSRDAFGKFLLRTLAHEYVGVDDVELVDAATTLAFVARAESGERDFMFVRNPGADSLLEQTDVNERSLMKSRVLHFGGVLLSSEPARSTCLTSARNARSAGVFVSFDPNARPSLFRSHDEMVRMLREGSSLSTLVKLSDEDLLNMEIAPDDPLALFNDVTKAVVVTRGARPCAWYLRDNGQGEVSAPNITPVDTTGAGDAMMAALLWRLVWTHELKLTAASLHDAVRYGCAAGALACLHEGAIPSLPDATAVEAILSQVGSSELPN